MDNIKPTAVDAALVRAQQAFEQSCILKESSVRGQHSDARLAFNGNVEDASQKLFGKGGFVNSLLAQPDGERLAFAQQALEHVHVGSKGKTTSIELQRQFIASVVDTLSKSAGASHTAFANTVSDDLRTTVEMPLTDSGRINNGPHVAKSSLEHAAGKAFEAMATAAASREAAFLKAQEGIKDITEAQIKKGFEDRLAEASGFLFHNKGSVIIRLQNAQSTGQVQAILDSAYSELPKLSKTMMPVAQAALDSFVDALSEKEPNFSFKRAGRQR